MIANRRTAREWAVQMLVAAELNPPEDLQAMIASFWHDLAEIRPSRGLRQVSEDRVKGVLSAQKEIDSIIVAHLEHWDLDRLGTVERAVLRMGVWEMNNSDVDPIVIINECVDIVNWFSMPQSRSIVNAILDSYRKKLGKEQ